MAFAGVAVSSRAAQAADGLVHYSSPKEAYEMGRRAFHRQSWDEAMRAFSFAAKGGVGLADFYRARMFADAATPFYSKPKAYFLYVDLTKELINIDPDVDARVKFAGQTLTALARFLRDGVEEIDLPPDPRRAYDFLNHAWTFFQDKDAEFEIARMRLYGEGLEQSPALALHSLSRLARSGHAGALATLADLYWRGSQGIWRGKPQVKADPVLAYMFSRLAVEGAPYSDRIWIEDTYQRIYCGASDAVRSRGGARVAGWRKRYGEVGQPTDLGQSFVGLIQRPVRTCSDGAPVVFPRRSEGIMAKPKPPVTTMPALHGDAAGFPLPGSNGN
ncbi:MAG: hypothetical protein RLZ98_3701 [Pseudomonadota bacterium]